MKIKITLKRSLIGRPAKTKKIVRALGLSRPNQSIVHNDTPSLKGMIRKVPNMIEVVSIKQQEARKLKDEEGKKRPPVNA